MSNQSQSGLFCPWCRVATMQWKWSKCQRSRKKSKLSTFTMKEMYFAIYRIWDRRQSTFQNSLQLSRVKSMEPLILQPIICKAGLPKSISTSWCNRSTGWRCTSFRKTNSALNLSMSSTLRLLPSKCWRLCTRRTSFSGTSSLKILWSKREQPSLSLSILVLPNSWIPPTKREASYKTTEHSRNVELQDTQLPKSWRKLMSIVPSTLQQLGRVKTISIRLGTKSNEVRQALVIRILATSGLGVFCYANWSVDSIPSKARRFQILSITFSLATFNTQGI